MRWGEYIAVTDDPAYGKVDLNEPRVLAQDGFSPSEGNPQFHQQMTYAVAMTTIEHFERAIGRRVLWRAGMNLGEAGRVDSKYTQRLSIEPHAFAQENAFYDPRTVSLRFGYFKAAANDPSDHVPGIRTHVPLDDIVAHETTHAILDGMHRRFGGSHESGRARLPRGICRHRRSDAALHDDRGSPRSDCPNARGPRERVDVGKSGSAIWAYH